MKTFEASIFTLIFLNLIKKARFIGYHFEITLLWTAYSMKRVIDHKNSPREILEDFPTVLIT